MLYHHITAPRLPREQEMANKETSVASARIQFADNIQPAEPRQNLPDPLDEKPDDIDLEERARRLNDQDFHEKKKQVKTRERLLSISCR